MRTPLIPVIVAAIVSASCAGTIGPAAPIVTPSGVRVVLLEHQARSVALAGSFNEWSTSTHQLVRNGSKGVWTVVVPLPPGEHRFMYVVDGTRWLSPPLAEYYVDDGFGEKDGIGVGRATER